MKETDIGTLLLKMDKVQKLDRLLKKEGTGIDSKRISVNQMKKEEYNNG